MASFAQMRIRALPRVSTCTQTRSLYVNKRNPIDFDNHDWKKNPLIEHKGKLYMKMTPIDQKRSYWLRLPYSRKLFSYYKKHEMENSLIQYRFTLPIQYK